MTYRPTGESEVIDQIKVGDMVEAEVKDEVEDNVKLEGQVNEIKTGTKDEGSISPFLPSTMGIKAEMTEPDPSLSQTPTVIASTLRQKFKLSPTPTPPPSSTTGTPSMTHTPSPAPLPPPISSSKKAQASGPQLIGDLPVARNEALGTFLEISENNYQYKTLGRSREALESMTCDCSYEPGVNDADDACGPDSDCINRLTQVECLPDDCRCRSHCLNQRFQHKDYADIEIVLTEKKGYGLRAERDLPKDSFIYEYIGDVVNPPSFKKRMRDYAAEGIQHFYFMMLQKDEFIDATKSGGIGRFANHSCKPNCYVAKWTIGNYVRMGIFAKRNVKKHEELTFNYNVDRYGHQAQICYCGEPNCVGYIGGKTQTDIATMDDLYLDALGITDEADLLELKGNRKKKGKKIDDPDFMPTMKPIVEKDVPKVVQAIRQTQSRKVLCKLLTRIRITEDQAALRQIMRLRGYSLMTNVLEDYVTDLELIALSLECMSTWPLLNRNKVEDSRVIVPVRTCADMENESIKSLARKLIDHWETLPTYNRIPKRVKQDGEEDDSSTSLVIPYDEEKYHIVKRTRYEEGILDIKPLGTKGTNASTFNRTWNTSATSPVLATPAAEARRSMYSRESVQAIIAAAAEAKAAQEAAAAEAAAAAAAIAAAEAEVKSAPPGGSSSRKKLSSPKKAQTSEEKEANKEKRLLKLVGAVVVKCMSKHSKSMDHDLFKRHAKELTQLIADKEKKSSSYKEGKLDALSDEKVAKIKKFARDYIAKVLHKLDKAGKRPHPPSSVEMQATPSTSTDTPNSTDGVDTIMREMSVEEAMDMEPDSESDEERVMTVLENGTNTGSPLPLLLPKPLAPIKFGGSADAANEQMDMYDHPFPSNQPSDPRRRPPNEDNGLV